MGAGLQGLTEELHKLQDFKATKQEMEDELEASRQERDDIVADHKEMVTSLALSLAHPATFCSLIGPSCNWDTAVSHGVHPHSTLRQYHAWP